MQHISVWLAVYRSWFAYLWFIGNDRRFCLEDVDVLVLVGDEINMGRLGRIEYEMWSWYDFIHLAQGFIGELEVEKLDCGRVTLMHKIFLSARKRLGRQWYARIQRNSRSGVGKVSMAICINGCWNSNDGIMWCCVSLHLLRDQYIFSLRSWKVVYPQHRGWEVSLTYGSSALVNTKAEFFKYGFISLFMLGWIIWCTNIYYFLGPKRYIILERLVDWLSLLREEQYIKI